MCLLLDHGLRVGEVASLTADDFDLRRGLLRFYRQKVDKTQQHRLSADTRAAADAFSTRCYQVAASSASTARSAPE